MNQTMEKCSNVIKPNVPYNGISLDGVEETKPQALSEATVHNLVIRNSQIFLGEVRNSKILDSQISTNKISRLRVIGCRFGPIYMRNTVVDQHAFFQTTFSNSLVHNTRLIKGMYRDTEIVDTVFINTLFYKCIFSNTTFKNCSFSGCAFVRCKLMAPVNGYPKMPDATLFEGCNFAPPSIFGRFDHIKHRWPELHNTIKMINYVIQDKKPHTLTFKNCEGDSRALLNAQSTPAWLKRNPLRGTGLFRLSDTTPAIPAYSSLGNTRTYPVRQPQQPKNLYPFRFFTEGL